MVKCFLFIINLFNFIYFIIFIIKCKYNLVNKNLFIINIGLKSLLKKNVKKFNLFIRIRIKALFAYHFKLNYFEN